MNKSEIIKSYKKSPKVKGNYTKDFIKFNNKLLKEGKTDYIVYDNEKIFNKSTGRIVNKNSFYTAKGKLRAKFNNNDTIINNDVIRLPNIFVEKNYIADIKKYQNSMKNETIDIDLEEINYDFNYILKILKPKLNQNIYVKVGETYFALNMNSIKQLQDAIITEDTTGVYGQLIQVMSIADKVQLVFRIPTKKKVNGGAFFPYIHKTGMNLDKYGVFSKLDKNNYTTNCLCECFKASGIDYTGIKCMVKNQEIPMRKLCEVATNLGVYISVRKLEDKKNLKHYGDKSNPILELGLINKHYFLIEKTEYTSYCIKNYNTIKDEKNWNTITGIRGNGYIRRKDKFISSYDCIRLLVENEKQLLEPISLSSDIYSTLHYNKINDDIFTDLSYNTNIYDPYDYVNPCLEGNLQKNKYRQYKEDESNVGTYYFDFETSTRSNKKYNNKKDNENPYHTPYCVFTDQHRDGFFGEECGKYLLDDLIRKHGKPPVIDVALVDYVASPNVILIAHNAGYDFRFLIKYLHKITSIEKGTGLMCADGIYRNYGLELEIKVKCSLKMINMPLKKFGKCFGLDVKKEIMPYDLYSEENILETYIPLEECLSFVDTKEHDEYTENCMSWNCIDENNNVDILKYAGEYCYMDCIVLKQGYLKFRDLVFDAIGEDIMNYISLASMSDNYLKKEGCFKDVLMLSGTPRHYIQKCIVGGRTMCSENHKSRNLQSSTYKKYDIDGNQGNATHNDKYSHKDKKISDFDAVSLYPSAMTRMKGFLKGSPKIIKESDTFLECMGDMVDGYYVCCRITKVSKTYKFPCASIIDDNGIRNFTNDLVGKIVYFDKTSLEDFKNFQGGEVEIINGYYYNQGVNNKINETMKYLFSQRLKYKKQKNPIQMVFKELMNSSYGKTSLKAIENDNVYIYEENFFDYMDRNYNYIKEATKMSNGIYKIKVSKTIDMHFNNVHCGVEILSMSKRIMYEVMTLAEDNNYPMYITDTDSIHIDSNDVEKLGDKFNEKYCRKLIGTDMGQFHTDFDLDNSVGEIHAVESIFLGKKCYIDKLQGYDENGNELINYHIRMKGVPEDAIRYKANTEYGGDLIKLYNDLYEGKEITFNLLAVRPKFEMTKDMRIITKTKFNRRIKF